MMPRMLTIKVNHSYMNSLTQKLMKILCQKAKSLTSSTVMGMQIRNSFKTMVAHGTVLYFRFSRSQIRDTGTLIE